MLDSWGKKIVGRTQWICGFDVSNGDPSSKDLQQTPRLPILQCRCYLTCRVLPVVYFLIVIKLVVFPLWQREENTLMICLMPQFNENNLLQCTIIFWMNLSEMNEILSLIKLPLHLTCQPSYDSSIIYYAQFKSRTLSWYTFWICIWISNLTSEAHKNVLIEIMVIIFKPACILHCLRGFSLIFLQCAASN